MIENIKIRAYGKSELALLYFPTANSSHTAEPSDGVGEENTRSDRETAKTGLSKDCQVFHLT